MQTHKENKIAVHTYMWNPWHGCHKCSDGCLRCYMYERDKAIGVNPSIVKRNKTEFRLPIQKQKQKGSRKLEDYEIRYKIPSGSIIMTCLTSDFFIEEADVMREEAWKFISERYECLFHIITKRPERIYQCLPDAWGDGWDNVIISVTAENTEMAWQRIPILLDLPLKYRGITIAPMLEPIDIKPFLSSGIIDTVQVSGESYNGLEGKPRILQLDWVHDLFEQCKYYDTEFDFFQTGTLLKDYEGKVVRVRRNDERSLARFYNLSLSYNHGVMSNWKDIASTIEENRRSELARSIYKQITLEEVLGGI